MDASTHTVQPPVPRKRRWPIWLVWAVVVLACVGGWSQVVKSATFPRALAKHPVRIDATVTQSYINGFGGDPGFDYEYRVAGHRFTGSGGGERKPGEQVAVEYAADAPSESCSCNAAREAPQSLAGAISLAAVLTLPLAVLLLRKLPRLVRTRQSWFVPVHGFGEWIGFLGGILVAIAFAAFVLAYFLAVALER